ncbi:hypothetical protein [Krasilnikovia sp. MM14-A1004]|uniref:hypothetical protein n=1 Tax=Krasilnikovia sp. MM14-A1004 TaxID=3373541 RepID=UPI00399C849C
MPLLSVASPAILDGQSASWIHHPLTYLAVAAVCLMVALRSLKRAMSPMKALIPAFAAAAFAVVATLLALSMLIIAALATVSGV